MRNSTNWSAPSFALPLALCGALLAALLPPQPASAQRRGQPELEGAIEVHPSIGLGRGAGAGLGVDFRGTYWAAYERGYRLGPEVVLGLTNFAVEGPGRASLSRLMGGLRIAFDSGQLTPALYGRVGFQPGWGYRRWGPWWGRSWLGPLGLEGGVAIDAAIAPNLSLGGHMGLNLLSNGFAYLNLGAHFSVKF